MRNFVIILALVALLPISMVGGYMFPKDQGPVDTRGLVPFPPMDGEADNGVFRIVCKAYSNNADFDIHATVGKDMIGFRVVSDCVTLPEKPQKKQGSSAPPVPAMP